MTPSDRRHLSAVAALGCLLCGAPAEIHHCRRNPETGEHLGLGQRASNLHVLPLCPTHHRTGGIGTAYHAGPRAWESIHGTETELWNRVQALLKEAA